MIRTLPDVTFGPDGLVTAVVQDRADGRVLMVGHMDAEALAATVSTGDVHFHSRSRDRLWRKGETSGNVLRAVSMVADCDRDALLVTVDPRGPTCHRGTRSCFDPVDGADVAGGSAGDETSPTAQAQGFGWFETLWSTIVSRGVDRPPGSYTVTLLDGGVDAVGRKVVEEATEVILAAKDDAVATTPATRAALAGEVADLVYHTLVLLEERGVAPSEVIDVLATRHGARRSVPTS